MKQHLLVFELLILTCLVSCKKVPQDHIDATIYVKEYKTGTPIANAKVVITKGRSGSGIGSTIVETLYTDSEGKVDYNSSNADKDYMYYAEPYKDRYFDTHNNQVSVTRGKKNFEATINMYAESFVKLHVRNVHPFNQYDVIQLQSYCHPHLFFQGLSVDTTFLYCDYSYEWMGNFENYAYASVVTRNSIDSVIHYSFIPIPHDTITVNINF